MPILDRLDNRRYHPPMGSTTPVDVIGARVRPGHYSGRVTMLDVRLGLARIKPVDQGCDIFVPLWKFPEVKLDLQVEFDVGNGGVVALSALE